MKKEIRMRFWGREIAGWLLVLLGLAIFVECFLMLHAVNAAILQAAELTFIGFIVFRGGIHLLKVAVAARIAMRAEAAPPARSERRPTEPSWE